MKFSKISLLIAGLYFPVTSAWGYDEPNLIVTGTRSEQERMLVPAGVVVISHEEILNSGATSIADVLRGRGGLQIIDQFGDGSFATVDIRGFGESAGSNNLVMIDGRPLNNTDIAGPDLDSIALIDVERVEILQGSAGALYGDQAVSGVINIITRRPQEFDAAVGVSSGSYNRFGVRARLSDRLDNGFSYRVSVEDISSDNYRQHNALDYRSMLARIDHSHASGGVFLELHNVQRDLETPGALLESEVAMNRRQSLTDFANDYDYADTDASRFGLRQVLGARWEFAAEYTRRKSNEEFVTNFRGCALSANCNTSPDAQTREQQTWAPRFLGTYETSQGSLLLTAGADLIDTDYSIDSAFVQRDNLQRIRSLYVQAVMPVGAHLSYTVAARRAEVENVLTDASAFPDGENINAAVNVASLGFNFTPHDDWRLYARVDENFRFAKVDEQTFTEVGTIGLETQQGLSKEIGAEWRHNAGHAVKLAGYRLSLQHEIAFDPTVDGPFGPGTGANVNLDDTRRQGWIVEGRLAVTQDLVLASAWRGTDAEFRSGVFGGNTVSGVADRVAWLSADYRIGKDWRIYLEVQDFGEQYLDGDNANLQEKKDGYTIVHANLSWVMAQWRLSMRINNLADRQYVESANAFGAVNPSPERNIWFSAECEFK